MQITQGKIIKPQRVVVYGVEGIGKSMFAASFPRPVVIDTEGSTGHLDVARTPTPTSWAMLKGQISEFQRDRMGFQTLVIDTADWAERLCINEICQRNNMASLGGTSDYGRSYNLLSNEWGSFLDMLTELTNVGMNIVLTAHAKINKFELPEENGAYDRYELKLEKKTSSLLKEWPDMLLFANYRTIVVKDDKTKKSKAAGNARKIFTQHHACWDAKNRHGLAAEMFLDFQEIAHCIPVPVEPAPPQTAPPQTPAPATSQEPPAATPTPPASAAPTPSAAAPQSPATPPAPAPPAPPTSPVPEPVSKPENVNPPATANVTDVEPAHLRKLRDLMNANGVRELDIIEVITAKGYFPAHTKFADLPADFIEGRLIANWEIVLKNIRKHQEAQKATA